MICDIGVAVQARRSGLAQTLLTAVAERARADGAKAVIATIWSGNHASAQLFEAAGFDETYRMVELDLEKKTPAPGSGTG